MNGVVVAEDTDIPPITTKKESIKLIVVVITVVLTILVYASAYSLITYIFLYVKSFFKV